MRTAGPSEIHNRHKKAFSAQVLDVIRISDIIIEVLDARFIKESRNKQIEDIIKEEGKMLFHVITKSDLVKLSEVQNSEEVEELSHPIFISCTKRIGIGKLRERIHILSKKFDQHKHVHVGVIGYPNTGKSSLISLLARRSAAPVSSQPGFTKHIRKIRFAKGIHLLDVPGTLPENENLFTDKDLKKHSFLGVHTPENVRNPDLMVFEIMKKIPGKLEEFYSVEANGDVEILLEELGKRWNLLKKKGESDTDKTARRILKEWQEGNIK